MVVSNEYLRLNWGTNPAVDLGFILAICDYNLNQALIKIPIWEIKNKLNQRIKLVFCRFEGNAWKNKYYIYGANERSGSAPAATVNLKTGISQRELRVHLKMPASAPKVMQEIICKQNL